LTVRSIATININYNANINYKVHCKELMTIVAVLRWLFDKFFIIEAFFRLLTIVDYIVRLFDTFT